MKAVYCIELNAWPLMEMREIASPEPNPGEVLIRNEAWGVNYVDYLVRHNQVPITKREIANSKLCKPGGRAGPIQLNSNSIPIQF